jgi:hypothetical protein
MTDSKRRKKKFFLLQFFDSLFIEITFRGDSGWEGEIRVRHQNLQKIHKSAKTNHNKISQSHLLPGGGAKPGGKPCGGPPRPIGGGLKPGGGIPIPPGGGAIPKPGGGAPNCCPGKPGGANWPCCGCMIPALPGPKK